MTLDLSPAALGPDRSQRRQDFIYNLSCDLANASRAKLSDIKLTSLAGGQLLSPHTPQGGAGGAGGRESTLHASPCTIVYVQLKPDPARADHPIMVGNDLLKQFQDRGSRLLSGSVTSRLKALQCDLIKTRQSPAPLMQLPSPPQQQREEEQEEEEEEGAGAQTRSSGATQGTDTPERHLGKPAEKLDTPRAGVAVSGDPCGSAVAAGADSLMKQGMLLPALPCAAVAEDPPQTPKQTPEMKLTDLEMSGGGEGGGGGGGGEGEGGMGREQDLEISEAGLLLRPAGPSLQPAATPGAVMSPQEAAEARQMVDESPSAVAAETVMMLARAAGMFCDRSSVTCMQGSNTTQNHKTKRAMARAHRRTHTSPVRTCAQILLRCWHERKLNRCWYWSKMNRSRGQQETGSATRRAGVTRLLP